MPTRALMTGETVKSLDAEGTVGPANGETFAVPLRSGQKGRNITMTVFFSVAPAATDIALQGSHDNVNWYTVGNTTNVAGGAVTAPDFNFKFVRARKVAQTGAANATAELLMA